jgi:nitrogen fixation/metabolism regulation signal transduction histidine kinase
MMPGKTELRLVLALLVTSIVPLAAAIFLASSFATFVGDVWFNPRVGEQLDRGIEMYKKYVRAIKDDYGHQTDAIGADEVLGEAAAKRNPELIEAQLDALFPRSPDLVELRIFQSNAEVQGALGREAAKRDISDSDGVLLARRDRGRPVDVATERRLEVSRTLGTGPDPPLLVADFALARSRVDLPETSGAVVTEYKTLAASRHDLYRQFLLIFASLAGLTVLITLVLGTWLARGVTRRINRLAAAIGLVAEGDLSVRVPVAGSDELTELAQTFNHMLEEMETSRARIEFLQRIGAWQQMAQRLAHEIKNPLTPIQLAVQECHRKYAGDDAKYRALLDTTLEIVEEEVGTLRRLVGDFSNFARLPHAELREESLKDFLRDCSEQLLHLELEPEAASLVSEVDVTWEVPVEPLPVEIDKQMLRRVLVNLVRNGVQAVRDARKAQTGEKPERGHVVVSARLEGDGAAITVEDDGPGIPTDQRDRIFDPYFTTKTDGTGLGLAIVKKVVVEHGGTVSAGSSEKLGGAAFIVRLPGRKTLAIAAAREARGRATLGEGAPPASAR